ncbi:MAG: hypothetical protein ACOC1K_03930 [Nanoarchaeota archaeon]
MPEVRNVQSQQVDERCPVCKEGWMRPTGVVLTTQPPQYPHKCNKCNYEQTYQVRYPYIVNS